MVHCQTCEMLSVRLIIYFLTLHFKQQTGYFCVAHCIAGVKMHTFAWVPGGEFDPVRGILSSIRFH